MRSIQNLRCWPLLTALVLALLACNLTLCLASFLSNANPLDKVKALADKLPFHHQKSDDGSNRENNGLLQRVSSVKTGAKQHARNVTPRLMSQKRKNLPKPIGKSTFDVIKHEKKKCLHHIGCINPQPLGRLGNPFKMKIKMHLFRPRSDHVAAMQKSRSCDQHHCETYPFDLDVLDELDFDPDRRIVFIIPGFTSGVDEKWALQLKDAWLKLEDANVIVVSWPGGSNKAYSDSVADTKLVGRGISAFLYLMSQLRGFGPNEERKMLANVHLVGHSLGAHIASFAAKDFGGRIGRVSGLDPAGPSFDLLGRHFKLDKSDAIFVEAFHTNGGTLIEARLGHDPPLTHVDYYVNDGHDQPGCYDPVKLSKLEKKTFVSCNHNRAHEVFMKLLEFEALRMSSPSVEARKMNRIWAVEAKDYEAFKSGETFDHLCPNIASSEIGSRNSDQNRCLIPMDLTTRPEVFKRELQTKYGVNFDNSKKPSLRYWFKTGDLKMLLELQNLIQIRIEDKHSSKKIFELDLEVDGKKHDMNVQSRKVSSHVTELLAPLVTGISSFSPANSNLVEMLEDVDLDRDRASASRLLDAVSDILPRKIVIKELHKAGLIAEVAEVVVNREIENFKSLNMVAVQPLRGLNRAFFATYSVSKSESRRGPKLVQLGANQQVPYTPQSDLKTGKPIVLTIDTVYIGPKRE